jgi:long-chain acyl-CoA synthetase
VYPAEVERVLGQHPALAAAALIGLPDATYGERPCAVVVRRPGATATAADVIAFCRERLAAYKCPRTVVFVEELPLTASGKIARRQLKTGLESRAADVSRS